MSSGNVNKLEACPSTAESHQNSSKFSNVCNGKFAYKLSSFHIHDDSSRFTFLSSFTRDPTKWSTNTVHSFILDYNEDVVSTHECVSRVVYSIEFINLIFGKVQKVSHRLNKNTIRYSGDFVMIFHWTNESNEWVLKFFRTYRDMIEFGWFGASRGKILSRQHLFHYPAIRIDFVMVPHPPHLYEEANKNSEHGEFQFNHFMKIGIHLYNCCFSNHLAIIKRWFAHRCWPGGWVGERTENGKWCSLLPLQAYHYDFSRRSYLKRATLNSSAGFDCR